jgi:hypothetical protein
LYAREWFNRLWTFQELKLARNAVVLCGSHSMDWATFLDLGIKLYDTSLIAVISAPASSIVPMVEGLKLSAQNLRALAHPVGSGGSFLIDMIQCSIGRQCLFKEDRVYALLGLLPRELRQKVPAVYSQDSDHYINVYVQFMKVMVEHLPWESMDTVLLAATVSDRPPGMPSWCPNWSAMHHSNLREGTGDAGGSLGEAFHQLDATRDSTLLVLGASVDTVKDVLGDLVWHRESEIMQPADVFGSLSRILALLNRCWEMTEQTMCADRVRCLSDFWCTVAAVTSLEVDSIPNYTDVNALPLLNALLESVREGRQVDWVAMPAMRRQTITSAIGVIIGLWVNKVFFTTTHGRIGCGTAGVKAGDGIFVLPGQPAVYCLRGDPEQSSIFTSRAFVPGLMNGEASGLVQPEDFKMLRIG